MTRLLPILFLFLSAAVSAQNSSLVYPNLDQYENFADVYIAPEGRGYAVGSCNSLYVTTNDGESWSMKNTPPNTNDVLAVVCAPGTNCTKVYLSTNRGTYRSTDGGNNWDLVNNRRMHEMDFSQPNLIYGYVRNGREFYRSENDGLTWTTVATPNSIKDDIHFASPTVFTMIGDSAFFRSVNAGLDWTKTYQFNERTALSTSDDEGNHYVETYSRDIFKSEDGGITWTQKGENVHQYTVFYDMFKDAEDSLHVISFFGIRFSSGDDGETWTRVGTVFGRRFNKFRRAEGRLFAAGDGLTLLKAAEDYTDIEFLLTETNPAFREIVFHNTNTGFAFGEEGEVFRTTDGGENWEMTSQIDSWMQSRPKVAPDGSIYGVRDINDFIRSTDGGATWSSLTAANNAMSVSSSRIVFDVLPNGEVVAITNQRTIRLAPDNSVIFDEPGGETILNGGTFDLKMINANLGFIIRWARSEIYRTTDGGRTWTTTEPFGGNNFFSWFEVEDANTFLIGNGSSSWRTTDAGQTWEEYSPFTALGRFFIGEDLYGFNRTRLFRSRDDGANFEDKFTTCAQPLDMVHRPGTNEVFLTYVNGIERLNIDEILSPVRTPRPDAVSLRAVPNPTNGMVQVTIPGNEAQNGTAELFDLTGRRIALPTNQSGTQLELDLSSLRPGCYILRYASAEGKLFQARLIRN